MAAAVRQRKAEEEKEEKELLGQADRGGVARRAAPGPQADKNRAAEVGGGATAGAVGPEDGGLRG
eukprot:8442387-Pyramimonas_sp.AAC.2